MMQRSLMQGESSRQQDFPRFFRRQFLKTRGPMAGTQGVGSGTRSGVDVLELRIQLDVQVWTAAALRERGR